MENLVIQSSLQGNDLNQHYNTCTCGGGHLPFIKKNKVEESLFIGQLIL